MANTYIFTNEELIELRKGIITLEYNVRKEMEQLSENERDPWKLARYFDTLKTIEALAKKLDC